MKDHKFNPLERMASGPELHERLAAPTPSAPAVDAGAILDALDFEPDEQHTVADMANVGKSLMDYLASMMPDYSWNETPAEVVSDLINQRDEGREDYDRINDRVVQWAVSRWNAEVANRPLINVHRRSLDDTWRQVIRHHGGDPDALIGPSHDALLRASSATASDPDAKS